MKTVDPYQPEQLPSRLGANRSGEQFEPFAVVRSHDAEVPSVERRDSGHIEAFCQGDDRCIDGAQRQISIGVHQFGDAKPIAGSYWFGDQVARGDITQETHLGCGAQASSHQVGHLGDHQGGNDQRPGMAQEQLEAGCVMPVVCVDIGKQRTRIDDQRDDVTSLARMSSMRSEMSD